jgi:uncharacterized membrane protein
MAIGELITDQLPSTPARTVPVQFSARLITGSFCGAVLGTTALAPQLGASPQLGALWGLLGAVLGTWAGYTFRKRFAAAHEGSDRPGALIEDALAILGALTIVQAVQ